MKANRQTVTLLREADWAGPGGKLQVWDVDLYYHEEKMNATARLSRSDGNLVNATFGQLISTTRVPASIKRRASKQL